MDAHKEVVLFADESLVKSVPTLIAQWALKGHQPQVPTYYGYKSQHIFGTVNILTGQLNYHFAGTQNQIEFIKHLKQVIKKYPGKIISLYLDNAGWHKGKKVKEFNLKYPNLHLEFLPPYSPELNPTERLWKLMRKNVTHNHFYRFASQFDQALARFFRSISRRPKKIYPLCCKL